MRAAPVTPLSVATIGARSRPCKSVTAAAIARPSAIAAEMNTTMRARALFGIALKRASIWSERLAHRLRRRIGHLVLQHDLLRRNGVPIEATVPLVTLVDDGALERAAAEQSFGLGELINVGAEVGGGRCLDAFADRTDRDRSVDTQFHLIGQHGLEPVLGHYC